MKKLSSTKCSFLVILSLGIIILSLMIIFFLVPEIKEILNATQANFPVTVKYISLTALAFALIETVSVIFMRLSIKTIYFKIKTLALFFVLALTLSIMFSMLRENPLEIIVATLILFSTMTLEGIFESWSLKINKQ